MFLRCERFQVKPAAERIVIHFAVKKTFFGSPSITSDNSFVNNNNNNNKQDNNTGKGKGTDDDMNQVHVLARPILMSDLSDEDMSVLEYGYMQFLPKPDAAGRVVICFSACPMKLDDLDSVVCRNDEFFLYGSF